jgi:hypothetical protein
MPEPRDPDATEPERSGHDGGDPQTPSLAGVGDAPMRAAILSVAGCGALFGVLAFAFVDVNTGIGVLCGGAIATVNLIVFARVGQAFLARKGNTTPWGVVAVLKLVLLFGGVWIILKSGLVSGLSLAAGYAALPFGVTFASLFGPKPTDGDVPPKESARRGRDVIKPPRDGSDDPGSEP